MWYSFETSIDIFQTGNSYSVYFVNIINYSMTWIEVSSHSIFDKFKKVTSYRAGPDNILTRYAPLGSPDTPARGPRRALTAGLENGTDISRMRSWQCFKEMILLIHRYAKIKEEKRTCVSMTDDGIAVWVCNDSYQKAKLQIQNLI